MKNFIETKKIYIDVLEEYLGKKLYYICEEGDKDTVLACRTTGGIDVEFFISPDKDIAERFIRDQEIPSPFKLEVQETDFNDYSVLTEMVNMLSPDSVFSIIDVGIVDIYELVFLRIDVIHGLTDKFIHSMSRNRHAPLLYMITDSKGKPMNYRIGNYETSLALCTDVRYMKPEKHSQLRCCNDIGMSNGAIKDNFIYSVDGSLVSGIEINTAFVTALIELNSNRQIDMLLNAKEMYS